MRAGESRPLPSAEAHQRGVSEARQRWLRWCAPLALITATACWAISFPTMKAFDQWWHIHEPALSSWWIAAWTLLLRFIVASAILAVALWPLWRGLRASELRQGAELGALSGLGILLQMDALAYTSASVSAFLTQGYAVLLPLWMVFVHRRWPSWWLIVSVVVVMGGCAVLSGVFSSGVGLGRGEWETLLAALVFAVQILRVEAPCFLGNHMLRVSAIAFAVTGLLMIPVVLIDLPTWPVLIMPLVHAPALACLAALTLVATLAGMVLMFAAQRHVGATTAGLLYCNEPVFASAFAMFMPSMLSALLGISYANETWTWTLCVGGALIISGVIIAIAAPPSAPREPSPASS